MASIFFSESDRIHIGENSTIEGKSLHVVEQFTTVHNYIDVENMILRKGAVSAQKGENV